MKSVTLPAHVLKALVDRLYTLDGAAGDMAPPASPELETAVGVALYKLELAGLGLDAPPPGCQLSTRFQADAVPLLECLSSWVRGGDRADIARQVQTAAQSVQGWLTFDGPLACHQANRYSYFPDLLAHLRKAGFHTYEGGDGFAVFSPYDQVNAGQAAPRPAASFKTAAPRPS